MIRERKLVCKAQRKLNANRQREAENKRRQDELEISLRETGERLMEVRSRVGLLAAYNAIISGKITHGIPVAAQSIVDCGVPIHIFLKNCNGEICWSFRVKDNPEDIMWFLMMVGK